MRALPGTRRSEPQSRLWYTLLLLGVSLAKVTRKSEEFRQQSWKLPVTWVAGWWQEDWCFADHWSRRSCEVKANERTFSPENPAQLLRKQDQGPGFYRGLKLNAYRHAAKRFKEYEPSATPNLPKPAEIAERALSATSSVDSGGPLRLRYHEKRPKMPKYSCC